MPDGASASSVSALPKSPLKLLLEAVVWLRSIALNASLSASALTQQAERASGDGDKGISLNMMAIFGVDFFFSREEEFCGQK
jgi:hypothetical protein